MDKIDGGFIKIDDQNQAIKLNKNKISKNNRTEEQCECWYAKFPPIDFYEFVFNTLTNKKRKDIKDEEKLQISISKHFQYFVEEIAHSSCSHSRHNECSSSHN